MSMSETNAATQLNTAYEALKQRGVERDNTTFITVLNQIVDTEFQNATPTDNNIDITTVAGTLAIPLGLPDTMAHDIATACCTYWSLAIKTSGSSVSGFGITGITNDAMNYITPMETEILAINNGQPQTPNFLNIVSVIFKYSRQIIWFVDEGNGVTYNTLIT